MGEVDRPCSYWRIANAQLLYHRIVFFVDKSVTGSCPFVPYLVLSGIRNLLFLMKCASFAL